MTASRLYRVLLCLSCAMEVAVCQTSDNNDQRPADIPGLYFELLLNHLSDIKLQIEHQRNEQAVEFRKLALTIREEITNVVEQIPGRIRATPQTPAADMNEPVERFRTLSGSMFDFRTETLQNFDPNERSLDGDWIVIQYRTGPSEKFYRSWGEYRDGFGTPRGDHWLGLAKVCAILDTGHHELLIALESLEGDAVYAHYDHFQLGDEREKFVLKSLGKYGGTAGDSLQSHRGQMFTTYDSDNDMLAKNCAEKHQGAWWFKNCYSSHLNGEYLMNRKRTHEGLIWSSFGGFYNTLRSTKMMIRRVDQ